MTAVGYRDLLRPAHVPAFLTAALVGRLSQGSVGLATLLFVQRVTGSYAVAGAAVACIGGTAAVLAPARARWMHRRGPRRVLPLLALGYGLVLTVVALAGARLGSTPVALPALCALAGCLTPPLGPATRSVWSAVASQPDLLRRAYSLDAAADEVLFTLGPLVAGVAVALAGPGAGVLLTAALALGGTLAVAASPLVRTMPPARRAGRRSVGPLRAPRFARLLAVMFGVGAALGGVELVAVGVDGHGDASAGLLVATIALGGAVGSVAYGRRAWRRTPAAQLAVLCAALTCALLAALAATASPLLLPVALFAGGLVIAPALIVGYGLADRVTDRPADPEAGALVNTANNLGASIGTAATALVLDHVGVPAALLVVAAVALAATALSTRRWTAGAPSACADVEPDRVAHPPPVLVERPASFDDEVAVGADVDQAPQHVREQVDADPRWQRTLPLEPVPEVEQLAVALLLTRVERLVDLRVLPAGRRQGLVDPPHAGGDLDVHGDGRVECLQGGHRVGDRMPLDGRDDVGHEDVQVQGGQQLDLGREVEVDRLTRDPGSLRDGLEAGAVVAALLEHRARRLENLDPGLGTTAA